MFLTILCLIYPIRNTYDCLNKRPIKGATKHWCTFWLFFSLIQLADSLLSFIPMWWILRLIAIIGNYHPQVSEVTRTTFIVIWKMVQHRLNSDLNLQNNLDRIAVTYLIPVLNLMETEYANKLPVPLNLSLISISKIMRSILIVKKADVLEYEED